MLKSDLNEVVQLHIRSFPDFFLTSLGKGFLFELYRDFLTDESAICKVIEYNGHIKGFAAGNMNPGEFFRKLLWRKGHLFVFYSMKALIRNPVLVSRKLLFALHYRGEKPDKIVNAALLSSIGVDLAFGKSGFGSMLIRAFCEEAFTKGANAVYLTTDTIKNDPVNTFYIKNGFVLESTFLKNKGRMMNRYILLRHEKII